jgi:predicted TIM-barrel fold metal-dependent hydrolase
MREAADWFDNAGISEADRRRIGCENARRLFPSLPAHVGNLVPAARG